MDRERRFGVDRPVFGAHDAKPNDTRSTMPELLALPAPEDASTSITLDVSTGQPVVLDHLGPVVVNSDGTLARIANWHEMSEREQQVTKRRMAKRNMERLQVLNRPADGCAQPPDENLVAALKPTEAPAAEGEGSRDQGELPAPRTGSMADAWDAVAGEYAERVEPFTSSFAGALLDLAGELDGKRLLDVAAGSGAISVLAAIDMGADVTATDFSEEMLNCLNARPSVRFERSAGVAKLSTVVADGMALPAEWSGVFDVAVSSFGVIFFADPAAGVREMLRCLKPGAPLLISAWGSREETAAFQVIPAAAEASLPAVSLPAARPTRADGSPAGLHALLEAAGATDIAVHGPVTRTLRAKDAQAYWDRFALGAPATRALLATLSPAVAGALRTCVVATLEARFGVGAEVQLEATAYFATARRLTDFQAAVAAGLARPSGTTAPS